MLANLKSASCIKHSCFLSHAFNSIHRFVKKKPLAKKRTNCFKITHQSDCNKSSKKKRDLVLGSHRAIFSSSRPRPLRLLPTSLSPSSPPSIYLLLAQRLSKPRARILSSYLGRVIAQKLYGTFNPLRFIPRPRKQHN